MNELPTPMPGELVVLQSPPREVMSIIIARLAVAGPVQVLDAGNRYDAFRVARLVRGRTVALDETLKQINIARMFTCYQVAAQFEKLPAVVDPYVILDLTTTFDDEGVAAPESHRLLHTTLGHIRRLLQTGPVVISLRPPRSPRRAGLLPAVTSLADRLFIWEPDAPVHQPTLF